MKAYQYTLLVEQGPLKGQTVLMTPAGVILGRSSQCGLSIPDLSLSRKHCKFELREGELWVVDLASANATLVNDLPISEARLNSEDTVTLGKTRLRVKQEPIPIGDMSDSLNQAVTGQEATPSFRREEQISGKEVPASASRFFWILPALSILLAVLVGASLARFLRSQRGSEPQVIQLPPSTMEESVSNGVSEGAEEKQPSLASERVPEESHPEPHAKVSPVSESSDQGQEDVQENQLTVQSDPVGAHVRFNGKDLGSTPCRIVSFPEGGGILEVTHAGYLSYTQRVSSADILLKRLSVVLAPLPCDLRIVSTPEQAQVTINDRVIGKTPCHLSQTPHGIYRIQIDKPGYEMQTRKITLEKGDAVTETFRLESITGEIAIQTRPPFAAVLMDGKKIGITRQGQGVALGLSLPFRLKDEVEGEHVIELSRKGYATQKQTVVVKRGETTSLTVALVREFTPNYEVMTTRSRYQGILEFIDAEGIRLETAPGIVQTILMKDVKKHGALHVDE